MEARAVTGADLTVAASEEDADRLCALYAVPRARIVVAENGYDETAIRPPDAVARERARAGLGIRDEETVCAFVGSDVPHNRDGLALLLERVMPALGGAGFRLLVIGRVARTIAGRRAPWLIARGATPAIAGLLDAADVGVNPVVSGGGSNIKLPTYLAAGLAVVTTPHGLRGFPALAPLVTVAEPAAMAEALRTRPRGWARTPGATLPASVGNYAWGGIGERLGEAFAARLATSGAGGAGVGTAVTGRAAARRTPAAQRVLA
jgi:hypothetical protein